MIGPLHRNFDVMLHIWSLALSLKALHWDSGIQITYEESSHNFSKVTLQIPDGMITSNEHFKPFPVAPGVHELTIYADPEQKREGFLIKTDLPMFDMVIIYGQLFHQFISNHNEKRSS